MSTYVIEEFDTKFGKPTVLEQIEGTRSEARAVARNYRENHGFSTVRERWVTKKVVMRDE